MKVYHESKSNPIATIEACSNTSDKYKFQSSDKLIKLLGGLEFSHVDTSVAGTRKIERNGYQKHVMIFEHDHFKIDDNNKMQLLVTNSHDATSSVKFNLGVFRTVCANGLVVGDKMTDIRVSHLGNSFNDNILNAANEIYKMAERFSGTVKEWQSKVLTQDEIHKLGIDSLKLRVKDLLAKDNKIIQCTKVDALRRYADNNETLWRVFNRIQENIVKGRVRFLYRNEIDNSVKSCKVRVIKNIDKSIKLNRDLWNIASQLAS